MNTISIERAVRGPFKDPEWVTKSLLGLLWYLLVVTAPAVIGAHLEYVVRVARGDETLPDWDDFGTKWIRGLLVLLAGFVLSLPLMLLAGILIVPPALGVAVGSDAAGVLLFFGVAIFVVVAIVYGILLSVFYVAALANFAVKEDFGALFEVGQIWRRVRQFSSYWLVWLFALGLGIAASVIASVLTATVIGAVLVPGLTYLQFMMTAHLAGQWVAEAYPRTELPQASPADTASPSPAATAPQPPATSGPATPAPASTPQPSAPVDAGRDAPTPAPPAPGAEPEDEAEDAGAEDAGVEDPEPPAPRDPSL